MADRTGITRALAPLAATPVGFVAGAFAGGRLLAGEATGPMLVGFGLGGAAVLAAVVLAVVRRTTGRRLLAAALVCGGTSFALLAFMVEDFIAERIREARAFDAHYATLPDFTLELAHVDATRRPLSRFSYDSSSLEFVAIRPGSWRCTAVSTRREKAALAAALPGRSGALPKPADCLTTVRWRRGAAPPVEACDVDGVVIALADDIVMAHERRTRCRRD